WRSLKERHDLLVEKRPIGLEREEIIAATLDDLFGNIGLGPHGIDGDKRALQLEPLKQERNGGDLIGLVVDGLLAEHKALPGRPGGDQMQRLAPFAAGVGSSRRL